MNACNTCVGACVAPIGSISERKTKVKVPTMLNCMGYHISDRSPIITMKKASDIIIKGKRLGQTVRKSPKT